MRSSTQRVLVHCADGRRIPVDPSAVYLPEADGDETRVRLKSSRVKIDVRALGELLDSWGHGPLFRQRIISTTAGKAVVYVVSGVLAKDLETGNSCHHSPPGILLYYILFIP